MRELALTLQRPMFPSYRNQSVDLLYKSTDWFLYDGNIGRYRVKWVNPIFQSVSELNGQLKSLVFHFIDSKATVINKIFETNFSIYVK